jgi:hypothetical protein
MAERARKRYRRKCQRLECGRMYEAWQKTQRHCSVSCGIKARGPAWWAAHQAKITAIRKANGYSRFIQRMRAAGLTDAQIDVVRKELLTARSSAHTAGKRLGWAEALGEAPEIRWRKGAA